MTLKNTTPHPELDRVEREKQFHNTWANEIDLSEILVRESFESPTAIENRYILEQMGNIRGLKILDLGSGAGEGAVYLAMKGAEVWATDISDGLLKVGQALAEKHGVQFVSVQADAGNLPFDDNTFDYVFGNGVLHHVPLLPTYKEVQRILKKGGKGFFIEPLPYNPAINVYRHLAKAVRTEDEKPLHFKQINQMSNFFATVEHKEFWLFSLLIFFDFFFVKKWHPGKVRYWKKVIEEGDNCKELFSRLQKWDHFFLTKMPFLGRLCWNTVITATK
jgi:SAM-dependent methyltransferase